MNGLKKILIKTSFWNLVYPLLFGFFISNFSILIFISTVITLHVILCAVLEVEPNKDGNFPSYLLLSYFVMLIFIYFWFDEDFKQLIKKIKYKVLVKRGLRCPENWDTEKI